MHSLTAALAARLLPWSQSQTSQVLPPKEEFMEKSLPGRFYPPGRGCCSPYCAVTLPCPGSSSIPSQRGQAHPGRALPSWRESAFALSPCSFYYCKISSSCLMYFQLVTACPPSTSTVFPRAQPLPVLLQSRDLSCDTEGGYTIWGIRGAPHCCLPRSITVLPAAWPATELPQAKPSPLLWITNSTNSHCLACWSGGRTRM